MHPKSPGLAGEQHRAQTWGWGKHRSSHRGEKPTRAGCRSRGARGHLSALAGEPQGSSTSPDGTHTGCPAATAPSTWTEGRAPRACRVSPDEQQVLALRSVLISLVPGRCRCLRLAMRCREEPQLPPSPEQLGQGEAQPAELPEPPHRQGNSISSRTSSTPSSVDAPKTTTPPHCPQRAGNAVLTPLGTAGLLAQPRPCRNCRAAKCTESTAGRCLVLQEHQAARPEPLQERSPLRPPSALDFPPQSTSAHFLAVLALATQSRSFQSSS